MLTLSFFKILKAIVIPLSSCLAQMKTISLYHQCRTRLWEDRKAILVEITVTRERWRNIWKSKEIFPDNSLVDFLERGIKPLFDCKAPSGRFSSPLNDGALICCAATPAQIWCSWKSDQYTAFPVSLDICILKRQLYIEKFFSLLKLE